MKQKFEIEIKHPLDEDPWTENEIKIAIHNALYPHFTEVLSVKEIK